MGIQIETVTNAPPGLKAAIERFVREAVRKEESESRTVDSIVDALIESIANDVRLSGNEDGHKAIIKLTRTAENSSDLAHALTDLANAILKVFPVEMKEGEKSDASND